MEGRGIGVEYCLTFQLANETPGYKPKSAAYLPIFADDSQPSLYPSRPSTPFAHLQAASEVEYSRPQDW